MLNMTMYQALKQRALKQKNVTAVYYQGRKISYGKLIKLIDNMADKLSNRLNVKKDDVILVSQPNIPEVLILIYALNKIGAVVNLVHPFTPYNQLKNIIKKTNTKYAFLFEQRVAKEVEKYKEIVDIVYVTRIEDSLPCLKKFFYHVFMNFKIRKKLNKSRKFIGFKYMHKLKVTHKDVIESFDYEKTSVLLHSGSTTGDPKTICLCDKNFNFIGFCLEELIDTPVEAVKGKPVLSVLPSFHGFGFGVSMHLALVNGCGTYLMPKFSAEETAKAFNKTAFSIICGVPTMFESLLKCEKFVKSKYLRKLNVCYCGGDTMSISLKKRFDDTIAAAGGKAKVYEGYGLTEAVAVNCVNSDKHHKDGSIGYPINGATFAILDEDGNELGRNEIGEICIKSPGVMNGYFNDENSTKAAFKNGWLCTGDLGKIDDDGFIWFVLRKKRVVKVSGVGVFPTEIEHLVETVPGVISVCAIEIPDERLQAAIKLFVVAKYFDEEGMRNTILETCRKYLIRWAVPKEIEFINELPKTLIGKVDFKVLQKLEDEKRGVSR